MPRLSLDIFANIGSRIDAYRELKRRSSRESGSSAGASSSSTSDFTKSDDEWTAMLLYCIVSIVLGTSFMAGYHFRVTGSLQLQDALLPVRAVDSTLQSWEKINNSSLGIDILDVVKQLDPEFYEANKQELFNQKAYHFLTTTVLYVFKLLGMFWFSSAFAETFGRQRTLLICSVLGFLACFFSSLMQLTGNRVCENLLSPECVISTLLSQMVFGFQTGVGLIVAPALLLELAPRNLRGACGAFHELFFVLGATLSLFIDTFGYKPAKFHLIFSFVIYVIQCIMLLFCCESPRWLNGRGREEEAIETLQRLRHVDKLVLEREISELDRHEKTMPTRRFAWLVLVGAVLSVGYHLTGRDVVDLYGTLGLRHAFEPRLTALSYITVSLLAVFGNLLLVDRIGRRQLLFVGMFFMIAALGIMAFMVSYHQNITRVAAICATFYIGAFAIGPGPISNFMAAELFGQKMRLKGLSYSQTLGFFLYVMWRIYAQLGDFHFVSKYPFFLAATFAAISCSVLIFLFLCLPETSGGSLEDVADRIALLSRKIVTKRPAIFQICCQQSSSAAPQNLPRQQPEPISEHTTITVSVSQCSAKTGQPTKQDRPAVKPYQRVLLHPAAFKQPRAMMTHKTTAKTLADNDDELEVIYDSRDDLNQ